MDSRKIRENIRAIRKEAGLTQTEAAERLGCSRNAYAGIENGKTRLTPDKISALAGIFGTDEQRILAGCIPDDGASLGEPKAGYGRSGGDSRVGTLLAEVEKKDREIDRHKAENEDLKAENERLKAENEGLKTTVSDLRRSIALFEQITCMLEKRLENG